MDRIPVLKGFDEKVGGGMIKGSSLILMGPPGSGKTSFSYSFLKKGIEGNEKCLFITTEKPPDQIKEVLGEEVTIVDAYSWKAGGGGSIKQMGDLNSLNIEITKALRHFESGGRVVFDSPSSLFLYVPADLIIKFLSILVAKAKVKGMVDFLVIEAGVQDEKYTNILNSLCDGVIEFQGADSKSLRVTRLVSTEHEKDWISFDIQDGGVALK